MTDQNTASPLPNKMEFAGWGKDTQGLDWVILLITVKNTKTLIGSSLDDLMNNPKMFAKKLTDAGLTVLTPEARTKIIKWVQAIPRSAPTFLVMTKPGFTPDNAAFVLPGATIGVPNQKLYVEFSGRIQRFASKFIVRGSVDDWKRTVGQKAVGNSRLIYALTLALSTPVGFLLGQQHFLSSFIGGGGDGKSTFGGVASLGWCCHHGKLAEDIGGGETFKATKNELDYIHIGHNHTFLFADETRTGTGKLADLGQTVAEYAMSHSSGTVKARMTDEKPPETFYVNGLLTANRALGDEAGYNFGSDRAFFDRLIEIPMRAKPDRPIENIPDGMTHEQFCVSLKQDAIRNAGIIGREFMRKLLDWMDDDEKKCLAWLEKRHAGFIKHHKVADAPPRVVQRLATVYAAGRLAIRFKLFPWERRDLLAAMRSCLEGHVAITKRRPKSNGQAEQVIMIIGDYLNSGKVEEIGPGRYPASGPRDRMDVTVYGVEYSYTPQLGSEILFQSSKFDSLFRAGKLRAADAKRSLDMLGLMVSNLSKSGHVRFSVKRTVAQKKNGKPIIAQRIAIKREEFFRLYDVLKERQLS